MEGVDQTEPQLALALAALGCVAAEFLLEVRPDLEGPLKTAVLKWANLVKDSGPSHALADQTLTALSRALHNPSLFPKREP